MRELGKCKPSRALVLRTSPPDSRSASSAWQHDTGARWPSSLLVNVTSGMLLGRSGRVRGSTCKLVSRDRGGHAGEGADVGCSTVSSSQGRVQPWRSSLPPCSTARDPCAEIHRACVRHRWRGCGEARASVTACADGQHAGTTESRSRQCLWIAAHARRAEERPAL